MQTKTVKEALLSVDGMDCASCQEHVRKAALTVPGVGACEVQLTLGRARFQYDPTHVRPEQVARAVTEAGYPAQVLPDDLDAAVRETDRVERQRRETRAWGRRALIGAVLWGPVELLHWILVWTGAGHADRADSNWMTWLSACSGTLAILLVGGGFYRSAWRALKRFTSNMDTLIAMGASVAYGYSLVAWVGYETGAWGKLPDLYFMEAAGLLALISLGHWMEARARRSAGRAIHELLQLTPATAQRLPGNDPESGQLETVPVVELEVGDLVLVRPGDRVPIDGEVMDGTSDVDEAMLTGESLPVSRAKGDTVIGGTQNVDGRLAIRVTRTGADTALARIVKLVENAQASRPAIQRLADRVAAVFVPSVLMIALATGIGWWLWGSADPAQRWGQIAVAVCSVLIIACPCALGLAVPAALMVGTGRAARMGILMRDIDALQSAEKLDLVALDKTGTVTEGRPMVSALRPHGATEPDTLLRLAASVERYSEHPLAQAVVMHAEQRGVSLDSAEEFRNEPGQGVQANVGGRHLLVGNASWLAGHGVSADLLAGPSGTGIHVAALNPRGTPKYLGSIVVSDAIKSDSKAAIAALRDLGLEVALITGDSRAVAETVAREAGIDDIHAEVPPGGKAEAIKNLQRGGRRVAMVGDGINDAPALAQADLGIAMGGGSDIAKETGGIVLVGGSLRGIAAAIGLSRATMRKIRQNLFFAFFYNVLAIPLAALGLLNPMIAAGAMALSDVTVIGNALLLRRVKLTRGAE